MPCYTPLTAFRAKAPEDSHSYITFCDSDPFIFLKMSLPCGKCLGCRLDYARQWSVRCVHEASLHERNCFLTLTYDETHVPYSLVPEHWSNFMKRLRFKYFGSAKSNVRYFMCGEYGAKLSRPHYHACIFNFDFDDKAFFKNNKHGDRLFISDSLQSLWGHGYCWIGDVTQRSAGYVARYTAKKLRGDNDSFYQGRVPEFSFASRRPAIGADWFKKFYTDIYNYDVCVVNGVKQRPPRYYDKLLEKYYPEFFEAIKICRESLAPLASDSPARKTDIHEVQLLRQSSITRDFECSDAVPISVQLYDQRSIDYNRAIIKMEDL